MREERREERKEMREEKKEERQDAGSIRKDTVKKVVPAGTQNGVKKQ